MSNAADFDSETTAPVASLALERIVRSPAALVENLPVGIYTCDRNGLVVQFNRRAAELWGRKPEIGVTQFTGALKVFTLDGEPVDSDYAPIAEVLKTGRPVRDREVVIEKADGTRITVLSNADPIFDEAGQVVGGVNCFQDISEQKRMQNQMSEGRRVGRRVMEALPAALYTTDAKGKLLYFNQAAEQLWGVKPQLGSAFWCGSWKIYQPDGSPLALEDCPMARAIQDKRPQIGPEILVERPDGTRVPCMPHPTPIFDSKGEMIGAVNMLIDLTEQKRADSQQRSLIDELNHRVKNTLATVQSLAAQTMRGPDGGNAKSFEGRLIALSKTHDQLTRQSWEWANLLTIAGETFAPFRGGVNSNVHVEGEPLRLPARIALPLSMVLHELAANAVKYGALSTPAGSLALSWSVRDGHTLVLVWCENGGPPVMRPRKRGFGTRLLERSIAHELGGKTTTEYATTGVHCTMEIPLPA